MSRPAAPSTRGPRWPGVPVFLTLRAAAAAVGAAVAPVLVPADPAAVLAGGLVVVALLVVGDALAALDPRALTITRTLPDVALVGREEPVTVEVTNPADRRLVVAVHDATARSLDRAPLRHRGVVLPPRGRVTLPATITPQRRGRRHLGPVTVRVTGPLGIAGRQRTLPAPATVKVHPRLPGRRAALARLRDVRRQPLGSRATRVRGSGTTFDGLREYHADDPYRHINWQATARHGSPITTVYTEERNQQVLVLLDTSRMSAGTVAGAPRLEWSIDAAVALAELAAHQGDYVGAAAFDDRLRTYVPPRPGRRQAARVLDAVFDAEPSLTAPAYRATFAAVLGRQGRRALLVLLTDLADEAVLEPLIGALPILLGRHLVTVAAVRDQELERQARLVPRQPGDAAHKAAAAATLEARERSARRLRQLGAHVLDEPAQRLAAALADDYLTIKHAGTL